MKIVGPKAPPAARSATSGPHMLVHRFLADYAITEGDCLLICPNDGGMAQGLQQGFVEMTELKITALYPNEEIAKAAEKRIAEAGLADRITCKVGTVDALPFERRLVRPGRRRGPDPALGRAGEGHAGDLPRASRGRRGPGRRPIPRHARLAQGLQRDAPPIGRRHRHPGIRVIDDMGQWVEIRKGIKDRGFRD